MSVTKEQTLAAVKTLIAVAETIREAKQVPAGTLYAMLMGVMDLPTFESMVNTLVNTGLVGRGANHMLVWIEPVITAGKEVV